MEQQEMCQAICHYKTESKSPEIIFSTLEHCNKQPRKGLFLPKNQNKPTKQTKNTKKTKRKNPQNNTKQTTTTKTKKTGGCFQEVGQGTAKSGLLPMGSPSFHPESASSMTRYRKYVC